jgi:hypothetical protein
MAFGPGSVYISGGGIPGYPDNGTGYLEMPDGNLSRLRFGYNVFPAGTPVNFNLLSFDAAVYASLGPQTLEIVGYKYETMAPPITVTNFLTVSGQTFQTFYFDSSFKNVFQVDVLNARWSLDNLTISGVPEPSVGILALLGIVVWATTCRRTKPRP